MIDAVLVFGILNIAFEFVLLAMLPPRTRLKLLGNESACVVLHFGILLLNITIHWGTLVGTMASILAFCASIITVQIARKLFGKIVDGRYYHVGVVKYSIGELT